MASGNFDLKRRRVLAAVAAAACAVLIGVSAFGIFTASGGDVAALFQTTAETGSSDGQAGEADANSGAADQETDDGASGDSSASQDDGAGSDGSGNAVDSSGGSGNAGGDSGSGNPGGGSSAGSATGGSGSSSSTPDTVTVRISVDSSAADGRVSASKTVTFEQGATVYDALCALGLSVSASDGPFGVYVSAIGGLAEKEFGGQSGWKYSVNGSEPSEACSKYVLSDGDVVRWYYALEA